ncbi:MAG: hypothetical protein EB060_06050 [Proteobacteria bacterium]|nr:hypothetical protein [Pseudomonadota bacterium]
MSSWPIIYNDDNKQIVGAIEQWVNALAQGAATVEQIAEASKIPVQSVIHAMSCFHFDVGEIYAALDILSKYKEPDVILQTQRIRCMMALPKEDKDAMYGAARTLACEYLAQDASLKRTDFEGWDLNPERKIRIGFLCTYAYTPPALITLKPLLERLDRSKFSVRFFSFGMPVEWLKTFGEEYIHFNTRDENAIYDEAIRQKVDMLFDLTGVLRSDYPLTVFARRAAPVQVSWFNTCITSGVEEIQYFLFGKNFIPPEDFHYYSEEIVEVDGVTDTNYHLPEYPITPMPCATNPHFTFGSFTALFKHNDDVLEQWAKIMKKAPHTRLFLKAPHASWQRFLRRLAGILTKHGVDLSRVDFEEGTPFDDMMAKYAKVDLCLNTFSYGAGTTSGNALWMGIPTLTVPQSRYTAILMESVGLPYFVARDDQDYIEKAVYFANKPDKLKEVRRTIREKLKKTTHYNADLFAPEFEKSCRRIWQHYCKTHAKEPV